MASTGDGAPLDALKVFADELKAGYDSLVAAQEEEALKGPTGGYRRKNQRGRASSPLDGIRPERWTGEMTRELLQLLWVLEATVEAEPELAALLEEIVASEVFTADELPKPTEEEREPPTAGPRASQRSLLDASGA